MKGCNQEFKATCKLMPKTQHSRYAIFHKPSLYAIRFAKGLHLIRIVHQIVYQICGISASTRSKMTSELSWPDLYDTCIFVTVKTAAATL